MPRMKRRSVIDHARTMRGIQGRFNPLRGLTPDRLTNYLENYERGYLAEAVWMFDRMISRDDLLPGLVEKRTTAPARRNWSIKKLEDTPEAQTHADELEYFYHNLTATSAVDGDQLEGFSGLIEQMMTAACHGWSVHETIWKPEPDGLSAEFRHVPLWFFERITGKLRFTESIGSQNGIDLEPGGWMVTRGPALMVSSAVNYMFKSLPKKDWLAFCDKYAVTPVFGRTNAAKDSPEWDAMHDALVDFMTDFMAVVGGEDSFEFPDVPTGQLIPMKDLIELCDKRSMQLWRGGDLSTQSSEKEAVGSERQSQEAEILEANDLRRLVTTLNKRIDTQVIKYTTGDDRPLALLEMKIPEHRDIEGDINTDRFFIEHGIPLPIGEIYRRYNRREPEKGEDVTTTEATVGGVGTRSMIDKHSDGNQQPDPKTGKVQGAPDDPDQGDKNNEEEEEEDELANEDREALILDAVGRSLDVLPGAMVEVGDLIRDLIAAAESGNLGDDELIEAADEAILRMPELLGGRSVSDLARVFEGALFSAAGQAFANAFNPNQARYPKGHPQGGQWRPVDGDSKNNEDKNDGPRNVQKKGDGSGSPNQKRQGQDGDLGGEDGSAGSGFAVGSDRAEDYRNAIARAADAHKFGWAVDVKDLSDYADPGARLFLADDASAGAMVTADGDLVSVFKHPDSKADIRAILRETVEDGEAITSDYFDINGVLPNLYRQYDFVPVARVKFNPDYAPPGMPKDLGIEPDVVLGIRDTENLLGLNRPYDQVRDEVPLFTDPETGWDDAVAERQRTLEKLADLMD